MSSSMSSMLIGCDRDDPCPLTIGALTASVAVDAFEATGGRLLEEDESTTDLCSSILWIGGGGTDGGETRCKSWF